MDIQATIVAEAQAQGLNPALAIEVARRESSFNQAARGSSGEIGIFQLMPATAAELGVNPFDPLENIRGGIRYLAQQLARFSGDTAKALAAYNCGPRCVMDAVAAKGAAWAANIPSGTRGYVNAILSKLGEYAVTLPTGVTTGTVWGGATAPANGSSTALAQPDTWRRIAIVAGILFGVYLLADALAD